MKKRKLLRSISMLLCAVIIVASPIWVEAEELADEVPVYYDTEQGRFVNNLDEYMSQLNDGMISPYAPIIEEQEFGISLYSEISDPSKKCSNIFGHKWGYWSNWWEGSTKHNPSGPCVLKIWRTRTCERTFCGATQTETDGVILISCHGSGN